MCGECLQWEPEQKERSTAEGINSVPSYKITVRLEIINFPAGTRTNGNNAEYDYRESKGCP